MKSNATSKQARARALLDAAEAAGCVPSLQGNWVVFKPLLPMALLLEGGDLGDALARELQERSRPA